MRPTIMANSIKTFTIMGTPPKITRMKITITKAITVAPNAINME